MLSAKQLRAGHWVFDEAVLLDEVFAQIKDEAVSRLDLESEWDAVRHTDSIGGLLDVFGLGLDGLELTSRHSFDYYSFEVVALSGLLPWSCYGSWIAWGHAAESQTFVTVVEDFRGGDGVAVSSLGCLDALVAADSEMFGPSALRDVVERELGRRNGLVDASGADLPHRVGALPQRWLMPA